MSSKFEVLKKTTAISEQVKQTTSKSKVADFKAPPEDQWTETTYVGGSAIAERKYIDHNYKSIIKDTIKRHTDELAAKADLAKQLDKATNTDLKDLGNITSLDANTILDASSVDVTKEPMKSAGVTHADIKSALSSVDASKFPLPKPNFVAEDEKCSKFGFDLGLSNHDASDWDWPSVKGIHMPEMFDMHGLDLGGMFHGVNFKLPKFDLPDLPDFDLPDFNLPHFSIPKLSMHFGDSGNLDGLGKLGKGLGGMGCIGKALGSIVFPDALKKAITKVGDAIKNADYGKLVPHIHSPHLDLSKIKDAFKGHSFHMGHLSLPHIPHMPDNLFKHGRSAIVKADHVMNSEEVNEMANMLEYIGEHWWYDKDRGIWDWDFLNKMHPTVILAMRKNHKYHEVACMATTAKIHTEQQRIYDRNHPSYT